MTGCPFYKYVPKELHANIQFRKNLIEATHGNRNMQELVWTACAQDILFYVKKLTTSITSKRLPLFGNWNNIGAPVVSFYTNERLHDMIERAGGTIESERCDKLEVKLIQRLALISRRFDTTIIVRKGS